MKSTDRRSCRRFFSTAPSLSRKDVINPPENRWERSADCGVYVALCHFRSIAMAKARQAARLLW